MKKTLILALALLACASSLRAADVFTGVALTLNSKDGIYQKGDTVKVSARLVDECTAELELYVTDGGKKVLLQDIALSRDSTVVYSGVYDSPKSIMVFVRNKAKKSDNSGVGFMVAPEEFRPGFDEPADFMEYWDAQKKALRKSKCKVKLGSADPGDKYRDDYECWSITLPMPEGNPVHGYVACPAGAAPKSLPIVLFVHSAQPVTNKGSRASVKTALKYARMGAIAIDINAHGMPDDEDEEWYKQFREEIKDYQNRPLTTREDFYFRLMYLREVRALDYVCSLREWDGQRVLVYGESQGGGQACAIAGLDERVTAAVINVPAMTDWGGSLQGRQSGWSKAYGKAAKTELGQSILPYFDGANFLRHSRAKLFMVVGFIDETCHPACVYAAYNAALSEDKVICSYPWRRHVWKKDDPRRKEWESTVGKQRTKFIKDYLK